MPELLSRALQKEIKDSPSYAAKCIAMRGKEVSNTAATRRRAHTHTHKSIHTAPHNHTYTHNTHTQHTHSLASHTHTAHTAQRASTHTCTHPAWIFSSLPLFLFLSSGHCTFYDALFANNARSSSPCLLSPVSPSSLHSFSFFSSFFLLLLLNLASFFSFSSFNFVFLLLLH